MMDGAADTVVLTRTEYDDLLTRLEDAEDLLAVRETREREAALGFAEAHKNSLPSSSVHRLLDGEHPVRVWREHRGFSTDDLAARAGIPAALLVEIESRQSAEPLAAIKALAEALEVPLDDLAAWIS